MSMRRSLHALVKAPPDSAIAKGCRFGECPRRQPALLDRQLAHLPKGSRSMAFTRLSVRCALGALAIFALVSAPIDVSRAQDSDPVVARVNGVDIHESDVAFAEEEIGANMPNVPPEQKHDQLINYLVDVVVLSQAAEQQK